MYLRLRHYSTQSPIVRAGLIWRVQIFSRKFDVDSREQKRTFESGRILNSRSCFRCADAAL